MMNRKPIQKFGKDREQRRKGYSEFEQMVHDCDLYQAHPKKLNGNVSTSGVFNTDSKLYSSSSASAKAFIIRYLLIRASKKKYSAAVRKDEDQ